MYEDLDEVKAQIIAVLDGVDFLDLLDMELSDLLTIPEIEDLSKENYEKITNACQ